MDNRFDSIGWLKEFAHKISVLIYENQPHARDLLKKELDGWISQEKEPPFPVSDNGYGESIDSEIDIAEACVILAILHDKFNRRYKPIGQYSTEVDFEKDKLAEETRKAIAYHSLIATAPEAASGDEANKLDYCYQIVYEHIETLVKYTPSDEEERKRQESRDQHSRDDLQDANKTLINKKNTTWTFAYRNEEAIIDSKLKGLKLIEFLLTHPNKEYTPFELLQETGQRMIEELRNQKIYEKKDIQKIKDMISEFETKAKYENDPEKREEFDQEIENAKKILQNSINYNGNSRNFSDSCRLSVSRNISTVLTKITPQHKELYSHFTAFLKTGEICSYKPDDKTVWEIS